MCRIFSKIQLSHLAGSYYDIVGETAIFRQERSPLAIEEFYFHKKPELSPKRPQNCAYTFSSTNCSVFHSFFLQKCRFRPCPIVYMRRGIPRCVPNSLGGKPSAAQFINQEQPSSKGDK